MTVRGFKLDQDNNLVITAGRPELVADSEAIVQSIRLRLQVFKGEWFLDESEGLPYFQEILVKNPNTAQIRRLIAERIEGTPGVVRLDSLDLRFDRAARVLSVSFVAFANVGRLVDTVSVSTP